MDKLQDYPGFFNLFKKILLYEVDPKFQLSLIENSINLGLNNGPRAICYNVNSENNFVVSKEKEKVTLNTYTIEDNFDRKLNYQSILLVLFTGMYRNIVVYDSHNITQKPTLRLQALLRSTHRRNSGVGKLTKIFIRKSKEPEEDYKLFEEWNLVPDSLWDEIENIYFNKLNGSLPQNNKNLLICVSDQENLFVHPVLKETNTEITCGLGILNSHAIILGSY